MDNDRQEGRRPVNDVYECLQYKAAELIFDLRDDGNATQDVIDTLIKGIDVLYEYSLDIIKTKFCTQDKDKTYTAEEACNIIDSFRGQSLFEGLQNEKLLMQYLKSKNWLVAPDEVVFKYKEVFRKNKTVEKIPVHVGYVVPFFSLLERLLNMPEILFCIDNPKPVKEGLFTCPLDAYYYRNHPVVKKFPGSLAFGTYVDDVNLSDTASTKPVHARFFYWSLLNLFPELRSSTLSINLLFCAETEIVKCYGFEKLLEDYLSGIQKLSSEEGVTFNVMGKKRCFHGVHVFTSADNPASANLAGFKESHFADHPCRQCMGMKPDIYHFFNEKDFVLRSRTSHDQHLQELESYKANPAAWPKGQQNPSVKHGVNSKSIFSPHCDVTKCFPQDVMHDVIHGSLKLEIVCLLNHVVNEKKTLTLPTINSRIEQLSKFFGANKPSHIEAKHLTDKNLRHSAAETLALAHMLPFALLKHDDLSLGIESVCDKDNLKCYILRLNLLDLQMAKEFTLKDVQHLRKMTQTHHELFFRLYPDCVEILKLHFEIHLALQILLFGPLRQHWCFRYEGKHAYFKRLCKILHNFTNIFKSLSKRHQIRQAALMLTATRGKRGPYLKTSNDRGQPKQIKVSNVPFHKDLLLNIFPGLKNNEYVKKYNYIFVQGVHYSEKDAFILSFAHELPTLGEIAAIYGCNDKIAFVYTKLISEEFNLTLNALKVRHEQQLGVILTDNLIYHERIPFVKSVGGHFVLIRGRSYISEQLLQ